MRKVTYLMAVLLLTVGFPSLRGYGDETNKSKDEPPKKVRDLMRKKLENSQKVLEGIAVNDFKVIAKHADELIDLSKQVEWRVLKTPQYEVHSNEFRRSAETLIKNATDKNLDAAALTFSRAQENASALASLALAGLPGTGAKTGPIDVEALASDSGAGNALAAALAAFDLSGVIDIESLTVKAQEVNRGPALRRLAE